MGRPLGSKTRSDDARTFIAAVERALIKSGTYDSLANLVCRKLHSAQPSECMPLIIRLLDMKFGKPIQPTELTGKDGEALKILIEHIYSK